MAQRKPYHCYVLWSARDAKFYIGVTENVAERLHDHNSGLSRWTRGRGPWQVVWQVECPALSDARKIENYLKPQKGGRGFFDATGLDPQQFRR